MDQKNVALIIIAVMVIQTVAIYIVTRANPKYFDKRDAREYFMCVKELSKEKPNAANVIKFCYFLFIVELFFAIFYKNFLSGNS